MSIITVRRILVFSTLLALTSAASAQQSGSPKKRVPTMSSDDIASAGSTSTSNVVTTGGNAPAGWNRYLLDGCGLSIALPGEPVATDLAIPADAKSLGLSGKNHIYLGNGYGVAIGHVVSRYEFDAKPFAEGVMRGISSTPGVSNLKYRIVAGNSASKVQVTGTWDQKGVPLAFEGFAEVRGRNAWSVMAIHELTNSAAAEQGRLALTSASFDGAECPDH